ncbi:MAG: HDIG domain-containing metalloprotein [Candidatus Delongbacteria bacterium]|jgi:putative nucleotidyltransferase with HDIG domain|nr:HDIG domain-containing protein [Candidatus Delongbacteria bacterium]
MTKRNKAALIYMTFFLILSVALTVYMMPRERTSEFLDYREGVLAPEKIIAPFDFEILRTEEELNDLRNKLKSTIVPVFILEDTLNIYLYRQYQDFGSDYDELISMQDNVTALYEKTVFFEAKKDSISLIDPQSFQKQKNAADSVYQIIRKNFQREKFVFNQNYSVDFDGLSKLDLLSDVSLRKRIGYYLRRVTQEKILNTPKNSIFNRHLGKFLMKEKTEDDLKEYFINDFDDITAKEEKDINFLSSIYDDLDNDSIAYWKTILANFSRPSLIFSKDITDSLILKYQNEVPLADGLVKKGDEIILKNMVVTKTHLKKLRSLELKQKEISLRDRNSLFTRINFKDLAGKVIISSLFYLILVLMVYFNRKKYLYNFKSVTQLFLLIIIQLILVYYSRKYIEDFSPYLVTMSVTSVLVAVFFDMRVAFATTVICSVLTSLIIGSNFMYIFVPMFSGLFTMYAVNKIRDIFQFIYKTLLFSLFGLIIPGVGFYLMYNSSFDELVLILTHSAINSAVSPLLALTFLTIIERTFKTPTDVTLLQLSDMSNPLLKKLQIEAPGTYHHSITVGNLAEAAAEAISANSLLARVGSYYHDIGKIKKAEYFIENQQNMPNKHDKMLPSMSAFVLSAHVKEGIKMAYENKLPEVIIDFIRSHHGISRMEFFYNKAVNMSKGTDEKVNESVYRYPGPKPHTKETAIVMLSDIIEAKCRTESGANVDRFRQIINEIIMDRLQSGELDECDIKLNDLSKIREAMLPVITGMYHQRIKYPEKIKPEETDGNLNEKK